eukprot:996462-Rhodomonas_salina.2
MHSATGVMARGLGKLWSKERKLVAKGEVYQYSALEAVVPAERAFVAIPFSKYRFHTIPVRYGALLGEARTGPGPIGNSTSSIGWLLLLASTTTTSSSTMHSISTSSRTTAGEHRVGFGTCATSQLTPSHNLED